MNTVGMAKRVAHSHVQGSWLAHITPVTLPSARLTIHVCDSCLKGDHVDHGHDHRLSHGDRKLDEGHEDYGRRGCKSVGHVEGRLVQCGCNPDADWYEELRRVSKTFR